VRRLAERWLPEVAGTGRTDFVCSPAGLWLALGAVAAGARAGTADELRELLGVAGPEAAVAVTAMAEELARDDALGVATRVWSRVPLLHDYRAALPGIGFGPMRDQATLDTWVQERTGGLIERLPVTIDPGVLLALVNVLALKARWETPFPAHATRDRPFTDAAGAEHRVPTMHGTLKPRDAWTVGGRQSGRQGGPTAQVVELRCAGGSARVRFVLGEPGASPAEVLPAAWAHREAREPVAADTVELALPRFALRTTLDITTKLPALGITRAISGAADFSGLSPERLAISQVVQEAVVKVAELGVEAAAVTVVTMRSAAVLRPRRTLRIAFDRPFGVVVLDRAAAVPLFMGWQANAPVAPRH
jgi:serpin B